MCSDEATRVASTGSIAGDVPAGVTADPADGTPDRRWPRQPARPPGAPAAGRPRVSSGRERPVGRVARARRRRCRARRHRAGRHHAPDASKNTDVERDRHRRHREAGASWAESKANTIPSYPPGVAPPAQTRSRARSPSRRMQDVRRPAVGRAIVTRDLVRSSNGADAGAARTAASMRAARRVGRSGAALRIASQHHGAASHDPAPTTAARPRRAAPPRRRRPRRGRSRARGSGGAGARRPCLRTYVRGRRAVEAERLGDRSSARW